jgi:GNAT superfamily N-acetyltransferase
MAADLIGRCYDTLEPSTETVRSWTQHPVYTADLWLWVVDTARDMPVGLGIAEFDGRVGEGSLEWIQVLPAYRGLGLGRAVVTELLRGLSPRAAFATVSGEAAGPQSPEAFYRRCGFQGDDVWWVLRN